MSDEADKRLNDLEMRMVFQDRLLEELNAALLEAHQEIVRLQGQLGVVNARIDSMGSGGEVGGNEKPPHY